MPAHGTQHLAASELHQRLVGRLRLRHLELLAALEHCSTLGQAARQIGVTQPAASQILREIEDLLEQPLFERHTRGLKATAAGQILAHQARQVLGGMRYAAEALVSVARGDRAPFEIGATPPAINGLLRCRLDDLRRALPDTPVEIEEDSQENVIAKLRAGTVQMAVLRQTPMVTAGPWVFVELLADDLVVVASPRHEAVARGPVELAELAAAPWNLPRGTRPSALAFIDACRRAGFVPRGAGMHTLSSELLPTLVGDAKTLAALPRSIASAMLAARTIVEVRLREKMPLPPIGAVCPAFGARPEVARAIEALRMAGAG